MFFYMDISVVNMPLIIHRESFLVLCCGFKVLWTIKENVEDRKHMCPHILCQYINNNQSRRKWLITSLRGDVSICSEMLLLTKEKLEFWKAWALECSFPFQNFVWVHGCFCNFLPAIYGKRVFLWQPLSSFQQWKHKCSNNTGSTAQVWGGHFPYTNPQYRKRKQGWHFILNSSKLWNYLTKRSKIQWKKNKKGHHWMLKPVLTRNKALILYPKIEPSVLVGNEMMSISMIHNPSTVSFYHKSLISEFHILELWCFSLVKQMHVRFFNCFHTIIKSLESLSTILIEDI